MLRNCSLRSEGARILLRKLICSFLPAPSYGKTMASPFSDDFVSYVDRHYPDVTVGSALKEFGIDPDLVGYHRIRKLTRQIEGRGWS